MAEQRDELTYRPVREGLQGFGMCHAIRHKDTSTYEVYGTSDTLIAKLECFGEDIRIYTPLYFEKPLKQDAEAVKYFLNKLNSNINQNALVGSYVYFATVNDEIKYIGKGEGSRWKHCISGASHLRELNKDLFSGKEVAVYIMKDNMTSQEALRLELDVISSLSVHNGKGSLYNNHGVANTEYRQYIAEESLKHISTLVGRHREA